MVPAAKDGRQAGTKDGGRGTLHGFAIFKDDDRTSGFGRNKFEDAISKLQPCVTQARLSRDAAIGKLIFLPDQRESLSTFEVAPEIDLARKNCG